jgi:hypothetical protein
MTTCAMHTYALKCGEVSIKSALGWSNPASIPRVPDSMPTKNLDCPLWSSWQPLLRPVDQVPGVRVDE